MTNNPRCRLVAVLNGPPTRAANRCVLLGSFRSWRAHAVRCGKSRRVVVETARRGAYLRSTLGRHPWKRRLSRVNAPTGFPKSPQCYALLKEIRQARLAWWSPRSGSCHRPPPSAARPHAAMTGSPGCNRLFEDEGACIRQRLELRAVPHPDRPRQLRRPAPRLRHQRHLLGPNAIVMHKSTTQAIDFAQ